MFYKTLSAVAFVALVAPFSAGYFSIVASFAVGLFGG